MVTIDRIFAGSSASRFESEANLMARVSSHPAILSIYGAGGGLVLHVSVHDLDRDLAAGHVLLEEVDRGVASRSESLQVREPGDDRRRSLVIQHQGRFSKARV